MKEPLPPHDLGAERAILGSLLIDSGRVSEVSPFITKADFYRPSHGLIYEAILAVDEKYGAADFVLVASWLLDHGILEDKDIAPLVQLVLDTPTSAHAKHYARIVRDLADRRRLIKEGVQMVQDGYGGKKAPRKAKTLTQFKEITDADTSQDK